MMRRHQHSVGRPDGRTAIGVGGIHRRQQFRRCSLYGRTINVSSVRGAHNVGSTKEALKGIDAIERAYYTVANGDGQTKAAGKAGVDVGVDPRPVAQCLASVLHATESDPRPARFRPLRRRPVPAILRRRWPAGAAARAVLGKTVGIDATTLEANAALRSIVRRDTGESYQDFSMKLAQASGIETRTRADLARLDRKRKKKGSNDDWTHPHDSDRSEEHTSELQSLRHLVCRLLLEKKNEPIS